MVYLDEGNQREALSQMWERAFYDAPEYISFYFDAVYGNNVVLLEESEEELRGMLHLNPYTLRVKGEQKKAHYIVGVCTEEKHRRKGVMRHLLLETFRLLRAQGEAFTYLMPADEAYYLPFSFQFGMEQYEQEIEFAKMMREEAGYTFAPSDIVHESEAMQGYVEAENEMKSSQYAIATMVSDDYFKRLEKEVKSESGELIYVRKEGEAIGRFVVYEEEECLALSQLACYKVDCRQEFLQQMLRFCEEKYEVRQCRITYPEDWKRDILTEGPFDTLHVLRTEKNPMIMFRILDLEAMGTWMCSDRPVSCDLRILDGEMEEQDGVYHLEAKNVEADGTYPITVTKREADATVEPDGTVTIAMLTARLFGNLHHTEENVPCDWKEAARTFWEGIQSLSPIEIPEIV